MKTLLRSLLGTFSLFFLVVAFAFAGAEKPRITFGIYVETGTRGVASTQARPVKLGRKEIMVKVPPVISKSDVLAASFKPSSQPGIYRGVGLKFSNAAGRALSLATRDNQGRELVVLFNNSVIFAAKIDTVIDNNYLYLSYNLNEEMKKQIELQVDENRRNRKLDGR